jgi:hypothetical protein
MSYETSTRIFFETLALHTQLLGCVPPVFPANLTLPQTTTCGLLGAEAQAAGSSEDATTRSSLNFAAGTGRENKNP